ncbi:MAG: TIGR04255 family protein [Methylococcales bacterium]|nr:TIGR04255 family protein [Methylococcales bacterium]
MESVIEFRIKDTLPLKDLQKIAKKLKKDYPNSQNIDEYGVKLESNGIDKGGTVSHHPKGFRLNSENQSEIVIITPQSLSIASLAPYPGWDALQARVADAWKIWKSISGTRIISRLGIRYINRIDIPLNESKKIEIEHYLTFYPKVPLFSLPYTFTV